jgi:hypothetical protein
LIRKTLYRYRPANGSSDGAGFWQGDIRESEQSPIMFAINPYKSIISFRHEPPSSSESGQSLSADKKSRHPISSE